MRRATGQRPIGRIRERLCLLASPSSAPLFRWDEGLATYGRRPPPRPADERRRCGRATRPVGSAGAMARRGRGRARRGHCKCPRRISSSHEHPPYTRALCVATFTSWNAGSRRWARALRLTPRFRPRRRECCSSTRVPRTSAADRYSNGSFSLSSKHNPRPFNSSSEKNTPAPF